MNYLKKYLSEFVYGGMDGIVTTFAIIAGAIGASLSPGVVLILGFANLFADGFSMAVSNYLSTKSHNDLHSTVPSEKEPVKTAWATFLSFTFIGFVPLITFVIAPLSLFINEYKFELSILLTAIAFSSVGAVKAIIVGKERWKSALETLLVGGAAALIAYGVGYYLRGIVTM